MFTTLCLGSDISHCLGATGWQSVGPAATKLLDHRLGVAVESPDEGVMSQQRCRIGFSVGCETSTPHLSSCQRPVPDRHRRKDPCCGRRPDICSARDRPRHRPRRLSMSGASRRIWRRNRYGGESSVRGRTQAPEGLCDQSARTGGRRSPGQRASTTSRTPRTRSPVHYPGSGTTTGRSAGPKH